jgi:serine/threonine protein kinase
MFDFFLKIGIFYVDLLKQELEIAAIGEAYLAESETDKKDVVLKVLKLGEKGTSEFDDNLKIIKADAEIGIKLSSQCKFLVSLKEYFIEDENCCFVMEYCPRGSLQSLFNKVGRLPEKVCFII